MWEPFSGCDHLNVDECNGNLSCLEDAKCTNTIGSHLCECQPGYTGYGQNCTGEFHRFSLTNKEALFCYEARRKRLEPLLTLRERKLQRLACLQILIWFFCCDLPVRSFRNFTFNKRKKCYREVREMVRQSKILKMAWQL